MTSSLNLILSLFSLKCASKYCTRCFFFFLSCLSDRTHLTEEVAAAEEDRYLWCTPRIDWVVKVHWLRNWHSEGFMCACACVCFGGRGVSQARKLSKVCLTWTKEKVWLQPPLLLPSALVLIAFHTFSPSLLGSGVVFLHLHSSFKHQGCP